MRYPCGELAKVLDYCLKISEFKLQSHDYAHLQTNSLGKGIELPYFPSYSLINILFFYKDGFGIR